MMIDYQHQIDVLIAETLEKLQDLNPDLYGEWYSKLYLPHGDLQNWNVKTLHTLEQLLIDYAK
jgi:DNA-binding transcriptional regulator YbjK